MSTSEIRLPIYKSKYGSWIYLGINKYTKLIVQQNGNWEEINWKDENDWNIYLRYNTIFEASCSISFININRPIITIVNFFILNGEMTDKEVSKKLASSKILEIEI